jgi:transcriptional regulator with XRE-family HTH domain
MKNRLKQDLKAHRYNFGNLAEEAGLNRSFLSKILAGHVLPSTKTAVALAYAASRLTQKTYTPDMFLTIAALKKETRDA